MELFVSIRRQVRDRFSLFSDPSISLRNKIDTGLWSWVFPFVNVRTLIFDLSCRRPLPSPATAILRPLCRVMRMMKWGKRRRRRLRRSKRRRGRKGQVGILYLFISYLSPLDQSAEMIGMGQHELESSAFQRGQKEGFLSNCNCVLGSSGQNIKHCFLLPIYWEFR